MEFQILLSIILILHSFTTCTCQVGDSQDDKFQYTNESFQYTNVSLQYTNESLQYTNESRKTRYAEELSRCVRRFIKDELYVNCSDKGLGHIPDLPTRSYVVDLSSNNIEKIPGKIFTGLRKLNLLDLSENPIVFIGVNAFDGLSHLSQLRVRNSKLFTYSLHDIDNIIMKLPGLTKLSVTLKSDPQMNNCTYCNCSDDLMVTKVEQFHGLKQLNYLEIDAKYLNHITNSAKEFLELKELHLLLTEHCFYKYLQKTCFENMPSLRKLTVNYVNLHPTLIVPLNTIIISFASNSFDNLENLEILVIEPNYLLFDIPWFTKVFSMTEHLRNITLSLSHLQKIKTVVLRGIGYGFDPNFSLETALSPLKFTSKIESFDISRNGVRGDFNEIATFSLPFKRLIVQKNCLSLSFVMMQLQFWPSVRIFDARNQDNCIGKSDIIGIKPDTINNQVGGILKTDTVIYTHSFFKVTLKELEFFTDLKYLDLSWNSNGASNKILKRNSLSQFPKLKYINLSGYGLEYLEEFSLAHDELEFLGLPSNSLGKSGCALSQRFMNLPSVTDLRLRDNKIECLQKNTLKGMRAIQKIDLSRNLLETFDIALENLTNLRLLNLSSNNIRMFTKTTMRELEALPNVLVYLSKNKLICNCESVTFLRWLQHNRKRFVGIKTYVCTFDNNSFVYLENLHSIVNDLEMSCASHTSLIIVSCLLLAFTLSFILGGVVYRYRWKLRYLYYMSKLQLKHSENKNDYQELFDYDAFISYASNDFEAARVDAMKYLEENKGLRLCIHERDFTPGESISYNISKGIHSSKKTILFFSRSFLQSEWCLYELNIARMESMYGKRNVILVVLLENIPTDELTTETVHFLRTYTYIEYPTNNRQEDRDVFWNKCADFVNGN